MSVVKICVHSPTQGPELTEEVVAAAGTPSGGKGAVLSPKGALLSPKGALLSPKGALLSPKGLLLSPKGALLAAKGVVGTVAAVDAFRFDPKGAAAEGVCHPVHTCTGRV